MPSEGTLVTKSCAHCGCEFSRYSRRGGKRARFCSRSCGVQANGGNRGEASPTWKGGMPEWSCQECSQSFRAYRKATAVGRMFCSWTCANKHHGLKSALWNGDGDMRSRVRYENELCDLLEASGYRCLRSAGSRGPADVYALCASGMRIIQVKSTHNFDRKGNASVFRKAIDDLLGMPCPPNVTMELWVRVLRGGWRFVVVNGIPRRGDAIQAFLATARWSTWEAEAAA